MEDGKECSSLGFSRQLCYLQQFEKIQRSNQSPRELHYASYLDLRVHLLSKNHEEAQHKIWMHVLLKSPPINVSKQAFLTGRMPHIQTISLVREM